MKKYSKIAIIAFLSVFALESKEDINAFSYINEEKRSSAIIDESNIDSKIPHYKQVDELFQTQYYAPYYFSHLYENYGWNAKGSCTYVAFDMLLSFYDTYWDDTLIPENYDMSTTLEKNQLEDSVNSPGVHGEPYSLISNKNNEEYYQIVEENADQYHHLKLIQIGKEKFGHYKFDTDKNPCALNIYQMQELIQYYLYQVLGKTETDIKIVTDQTLNMDAREFTISMIKQGTPVLLRSGYAMMGHAMIAYDYDEKTDEILVHPGWRYTPDFTHLTLTSTGYTELWDATALIPQTKHVHTDNFKYSETEELTTTFCSCALGIARDIQLISGNYLDETPTFSWKTLNQEKWFDTIQLGFRFSILDINKRAVYTVDYMREHTYTLTPEAWDKAISVNGRRYYVYIQMVSPINPYWDDYYCLQEFYEPTEFAHHIQIKPVDFGFEGQYFFYPKQKTLTYDQLVITVDRLRCGYIEQQYINLSPRRQNAGKAYLELRFNQAVYSYMFGVTLWSENEYLSSADSDVCVEVLDSNGVWTRSLDLLNDITLSTSQYQIDRYIGEYENGIYGIRFKAITTATGDRNKGRVCIDDIVLSTNPDEMHFISTNYQRVV